MITNMKKNTMEQHYEQDSELSQQEIDPATMVVDIQTPMGPIVVDMKQLDDAKNAVAATPCKAIRTSARRPNDERVHRLKTQAGLLGY